MRIVLHDYAGHPFPVPLARTLARRGHEVFHLHCAELVSPRGELRRRDHDPEGLHFRAVPPPYAIDKGKLVRRRLQEWAYGRRLVREVDSIRPKVVLSGNAPLDAQAPLLRWSRKRRARFVYWLQDLLGVGTDRVLRRRLGALGRPVGSYFRGLEARLLRHSDAVVSITEDFLPLLRAMGVGTERMHVIENWAPVEELPLRPKDNPWSRQHGLVDSTVLLYSGTLGMKHDPRLLVELAHRLDRRPRARVVVVSEGTGADWLAGELRRRPLDNLLLTGFQPFEQLPDVLGSGDVLLVLLEADAGVFSVPSKVLSGMCAGRALLLAVPLENLAARTVATIEAGLTVRPDDVDGWVRAAERLIDDRQLRERLGANARRHAEQRFDVERIADAFERAMRGEAASASEK